MYFSASLAKGNNINNALNVKIGWDVRKRILSLVFSGNQKVPAQGSTVPVENEARMVDPLAGIFLSTQNTNNGLYFSCIPYFSDFIEAPRKSGVFFVSLISFLVRHHFTHPTRFRNSLRNRKLLGMCHDAFLVSGM